MKKKTIKRNTAESKAAMAIGLRREAYDAFLKKESTRPYPYSEKEVDKALAELKAVQPKTIRLALKSPLTGKPVYEDKNLVGSEEDLQIMKVYFNKIKKPIKSYDFGLEEDKPKKKPIKAKRYNAKKLKAKHFDLWISIARQVALDMTTQKQIINSDKDRTCCEIGYLSLRFLDTVSENAAFTAIVEMSKRGLL